MLRLTRKLLAGTLLVGLSMTLVVIVADQAGLLRGLEQWAYDRRARLFQRHAPPPTDRLVHLDIDDRAEDVIGRWPWPRAKLAEMIDELTRAGPKVTAFDVIFSEPEEPDYLPGDSPGEIQKIDHDALLTAALKRAGNVILPVGLVGSKDVPTPIDIAMRDAYRRDLELSDASLTDALRGRGFSEGAVADAFARQVPLSARRHAAYELVAAAMSGRELPTPADLASRFLHLPAGMSIDEWHSPLTNLFREAYAAADAARVIGRLTITVPERASRIARVATLHAAPAARFGNVAAGTAFVDYSFTGDPIVRASPLVLASGDRVFLQLGLAMTCRSLDIDPAAIAFAADRLTLPLPDGRPIVIPVRNVSSGSGTVVPMVMDIPWTGTSAWQTMYDWPAHVEFRQHLSMNALWDACETRHKIEANNRKTDAAAAALLGDDTLEKLGLAPSKLAAYLASRPAPDDLAARKAIAAAALKNLADSGLEQAFTDLSKAGPLKEDERAKYDSLRAAKAYLGVLIAESEKLETQLAGQRAGLAEQLKGRTALIGFASTSSSADVVSTSLHDRCPGVVVHGAIFNAIMTRHFWRFAPSWVTALVTLLLGAFTAFVAATLSPGRAMLAAALLLAAYIALNGMVLFDRLDVVVGLAAPVVATLLVWGGCVLLRTVIETRERALVTRRFQAYVDPTLVDFVLEHPGQAHLEGRVKELTVVFTDLANFTTLSEELGERSVALLNEYMAVMVPIIRKHGGYVNKFLGDGIMCFYGAPRDNPNHAADAVRTALAMQRAMIAFNAGLAERGLPQLTVRVGVSTGQMVVGDAGSADCADYTVLGDAVNFGARLESANKYLGTRVLVSGRTAELAADAATFSPVGLLRVVGKTTGVEVFEALCPGDDERRVELTAHLVAMFRAGDFNAALVAAAGLEAIGPNKLAGLYRECCAGFARDGVPADFAGVLSLAEK